MNGASGEVRSPSSAATAHPSSGAGQADAGHAHATVPSSASSSGFFRQRNGSGILSSGLAQPTSNLFERFRRPRTATSTTSAPRPHQLSAGGGGTAVHTTTADDSATTSNDDPGQSDPNASFQTTTRNVSDSPVQSNTRSGLPRSSSSSQVYLPNDGANSPSSAGLPSRRPGFFSHGSSQSQNNIRFHSPKNNSIMNSGGGGSSMTVTAATPNTSGSGKSSGLGFPLLSRSGSSQGNNGSVFGGGGSNSAGATSSGFGRMFRRYSQGAGRNQSAANEAHLIAAANGSLARASGSSSGLANDSSHANSSNGHGGVARHSNGAPGGGESGAAHPSSSSGDNHVATGDGTPGSAGVGGTSNEAGVSNQDGAQAQNQSHRIRLVPHLEATRSLHFEPIERDLFEGAMAVKIGRFTDRGQPGNGSTTDGTNQASSNAATGGSSLPQGSTTTGSGVPGARGGAIPSATGGAARVDAGRIAFKSKVVSRGHAEIWCENGGKVFVRDTKSSSGTFLNHIRLAAPNVESKPFQIKDGDVIQLGVDYQGGTEEIYRCVKMRIELNRGWQRGANQFNVNALRQLRALQGSPLPEPGAVAASKAKSDAVVASGAASTAAAALPTNRQSLNVTDCCICLFSVTVCQALFIAPCSHVFHYKCIRPLLNMHHPGFSCPLCRTFADLEADVEEDEAWQVALMKEAEQSVHPEAVSTPMNELPVPSLVAIVNSSNSSDAEHFVDAAAAPSHSSHVQHLHDQTVVVSGLDRSLDTVASPNAAAESRRPSEATSESHASSSSHQQRDRRSDRQRSASRESSSRHRDSPLRRPDTAVSSSTAVPAGGSIAATTANGYSSPRDGRSPSTPSRSRQHGQTSFASPHSAGPDEELQEMLHEEVGTGSEAATYEHGRRSSGPIDIAGNPNAPARGDNADAGNGVSSSGYARHLADGFVASPGLHDSRTPQNDHFLSTLAEAPVASRNVLGRQ